MHVVPYICGHVGHVAASYGDAVLYLRGLQVGVGHGQPGVPPGDALVDAGKFLLEALHDALGLRLREAFVGVGTQRNLQRRIGVTSSPSVHSSCVG